MTTARTLIQDALFANEAYGQDQTVRADDSVLGLRVLQRMVDSWANHNLSVIATSLATFTCVAGTASYATSTWSPATRPVSLASGTVRDSTVDYPLGLVTEQVYNSIASKTAQGMPEMGFYKPTATAGTIYLYPTPDTTYQVRLDARYPLASGIALDTTISLPPGYEGALVSNLALALCPYFGIKKPSPLLIQSANSDYQALVRTNFVPPLLTPNFPGVRNSMPGYIRILGDT